MRTSYLFLVFTAWCIHLDAQTIGKVYLNTSLEVVSEESLAQYYRVLETTSDSTFKITVYYLNGQIKMTGVYSDANLLKEEGEFSYYYSNGQIESRGMYSEGIKFGIWKRYEPDGTERPDKHYTGASAESITPLEIDTEAASFPGGEDSLQDYIRTNLVYPADCLRQGIQGSVLVSFMADALGNISEVGIYEGVNYELDKEAERLVKSMPRWIPASKNGKKVDSKFILPITFVIAGEQKQ
jgi:TonB family protein